MGYLSVTSSHKQTRFHRRSYHSFTQKLLVLAQENANLKASVKQLYHRVSELEQENVNTKVVLLKEMTNEEATKEIQRLFATGKTYYYSDIAEELGLPLKTVVDICRDLENNGEIGVDEQIPSGTC
ncbi:MAG: hypothetical protein PHH02_03000 [Dehalococcoidales bacterium]|nr:hypothetical protein [Dehalococcoidales bacterium]MDD5122811.1 hypothetical protein [Dehalococcoidales bacterium]MDD5498789.1 hypothetical protein [Dehalococcoidales bacterium]